MRAPTFEEELLECAFLEGRMARLANESILSNPGGLGELGDKVIKSWTLGWLDEDAQLRPPVG